MNKRKLVIIFILAFILFNCLGVSSIKAINEGVIITTTDYEIGEVYYENYEIKVKRIYIGKDVGYCLEIDKEYPKGEKFGENGIVPDTIENALLEGYPYKSASELGLKEDNDAYVATQIAIWSLIENYDVEKFEGGDPTILKAIKKIYYNAKVAVKPNDVSFIKYEIDDDSVQSIVIAKKSTSKPITPAEPIKPEKPEKPEDPEKPTDQGGEKVKDQNKGKINTIPAERG